MGKPLSVDLRERVVAFVGAGHGRGAAFPCFGELCGETFGPRGCHGDDCAGPAGPGTGKLAPFAGFLGTRVDTEPDITMPELAEALFEAHGVRASPAALSRFLIREGYSYKNPPDRNRARARKGQTAARCMDHPSSAKDAA